MGESGVVVYCGRPVPGNSPRVFDQIWSNLLPFCCCWHKAESKAEWTALRSHDVPDVMPLYDLWRCQGLFSWFFHPLVQSVLFHASVAMLVRMLGRLLGGWGRVCVLLFKKRPGGSSCYPHPWELVSTFYLHLSVVSKYSFLLLTNPFIVLATLRASLFHITPPNQFYVRLFSVSEVIVVPFGAHLYLLYFTVRSVHLLLALTGQSLSHFAVDSFSPTWSAGVARRN